MRTRILMYMAILSIAFTTASATEVKPSKKVNSTKPSHVINAFIEAQIKGDASLFKQVLADDIILKVNRPNSVNSLSKEDLLKYYKENGDTMLGCGSNYEVLSSSDASIMARVDFEFPTFVQQNFISLEKDASGAWKITQLNRFNNPA